MSEREQALRTQIKDLLAALRQEVRAAWDRDLPFDELIGDRWARANALGFGEGSSIYESAYVYGSVTAGSGVWVGPFALLDGTGGLTIGDHATISAGVHVYTHDTIARTVTAGRAEITRAPVEIGSRTYLGSQVIVAKGVTIGAGSVIGAGSFVNRDVPAGSFAVGSPCRRIGRVEVHGDDVRLIVEDSPSS